MPKRNKETARSYHARAAGARGARNIGVRTAAVSGIGAGLLAARAVHHVPGGVREKMADEVELDPSSSLASTTAAGYSLDEGDMAWAGVLAVLALFFGAATTKFHFAAGRLQRYGDKLKKEEGRKAKLL